MLYINPLLARLESANIGMRIGNISTNCTACADDVALLSGYPDHTQIFINMCNDYAHMEGVQIFFFQQHFSYKNVYRGSQFYWWRKPE
jgi:hypothetical protein